jgi:hypothetical protein
MRNNIFFLSYEFTILSNAKPPIDVPKRRTFAYRHKKRCSFFYESVVEWGVSVTHGPLRGEKYIFLFPGMEPRLISRLDRSVLITQTDVS